MPRPHVLATDIVVANDPQFSPAFHEDIELLAHDLDDDEDEIEFEADDRHSGVRLQ